jgi:hypothetical protein
MIGFIALPRKKIINRRFVSSGTTSKFGVECDLNVLFNFTIDNISDLNGTEGYIKTAIVGDKFCAFFVPFDSTDEHQIKFVGNGLEPDMGVGFDYAEIFDDMIWLDYDGIAFDCTI